MGYTVLVKHRDGSVYHVNASPIGSTYVANPMLPAEARIDITFNYSHVIEEYLGFDLKELDGKSVDDSINALRNAIKVMKDDYDSDYWKPTEGNVKLALQGLVALACQCPDGIWEVQM